MAFQNVDLQNKWSLPEILDKNLKFTAKTFFHSLLIFLVSVGGCTALHLSAFLSPSV